MLSLPWICSSSSCPHCSCREPPASQEARSELPIPLEQGRASGPERGLALGRAVGAGTGRKVPVQTPALAAVAAAAVAAAVAAVPGVEVGRRRQPSGVAPAAGGKKERTWRNLDSSSLGGSLDKETRFVLAHFHQMKLQNPQSCTR